MLEYLLSGLDDGVIVYDYQEQRNLVVNEALSRLSGYKLADLKDDPTLWFKLIEADDRDEVLLLTRTIKANDWVELTYRIKTADTHIKWIKSKFLLFDDAGTGKLLLLNIVKDVTDRKQVDLNLEKALNDYRVLFDKNLTPMWVYELPSLRILKVNEAAIEHYGFSEEEFLSMTIRDIRPRIDLALFNEYLYRKGFGKKFYGFNHGGIWRHRTKAGETIYAEITGHELPYGDTRCRIIIATDVTQRVQREEEISQRELELQRTIEKLDTFIESITDVLFITDKNWNFTRVNRAFEQITGMAPHDVIGKNIWTLFNSLKGTDFETYFLNAVAKNESIQREEFIEVLGRWGRITIYPSAEGLTVFIKDITFERAIKEEINWTKNNLEALINNTDDLIWSIDRQERYVYMNHAYREKVKEITGIYPQRGDYMKYPESMSEEDIAERRLLYKRAFDGERFTLRREIQHAVTGKHYHAETSYNPITDATGRVTGVGCFARDITRRLVAEKAIMLQNNQLKHIASLSSHELRRPVASMIGLLNILDLEDLNNPENVQILTHLQTVGKEIDEVIHKIVETTFIENLIDNDIMLD